MDIERRWYQIEGSIFLAQRKRALLADEWGLGKTRQAVVAWEIARCSQILILCPSVAGFVWLRESMKHSWRGVPFSLVQSSSESWPSTSGVICSYNLAVKNSVRTWLLSKHWDLLIADESHYLNGLGSQRSALVWKALLPRVDRFWCLSATPAKNHAGELWRLLRACGQYHKDYWAFVDEFLVVENTVFGQKILGTKPHRVQAVRELLEPIMLRRFKKDVMSDLPTLSFDVVPVAPSMVDFRMWFADIVIQETGETELKQKIAQEILAVENLLSITKGTQDAATALGALQTRTMTSRRFLGLQKVPKVVELIEQELRDDAYPKIVLFAWHRDVIEFLRMGLREFSPLTLYGGQLITKRDRTIRTFQNDPKVRVLIAQIAAAGIAVDFTAASEVGFVEWSYVPSDNAQAVMRVHRFPQKLPVRARLFSVYGSVDDSVAQIVRRKTKDLTAILNTADGNTVERPVDPFAD